MNHLILENSPFSLNCLLSLERFLMAQTFPENICFLNLYSFGIKSWEKKLSFFWTFCTLLWGWWIAIRKLNLCLIPLILTHVSLKWTPKILSHMIMSKVLPIDWIMITSLHEVLEMVQSSNWTFLLGFTCHFLHCIFKECW